MFFITYKMSACQHAQLTWLAWYIGFNISLLAWFINLSTLTFSWERRRARPRRTISMIMCSRLAWQIFLFFLNHFFAKKQQQQAKKKTLSTRCFFWGGARAAAANADASSAPSRRTWSGAAPLELAYCTRLTLSRPTIGSSFCERIAREKKKNRCRARCSLKTAICYPMLTLNEYKVLLNNKQTRVCAGRSW